MPFKLSIVVGILVVIFPQSQTDKVQLNKQQNSNFGYFLSTSLKEEMIWKLDSPNSKN